MTVLADVDLTDRTLYTDGFPHDLFAELRAAGPVHRHKEVDITTSSYAGPIQFWSIVAHREIEIVNRDWQTFSAETGSGLGPTQPERRGHTIVSMDPPSHTRLRRLISAGFTPRMIAELESNIARRCRKLLDDAADRRDIDFVADIAYKLPMHVIADIVGIPDDDREWVFSRTDAMLRALDPTSSLEPDERFRAERDLFDYAQRLSADKRGDPADDIWTKLAHAEVAGEDGQPTSLSLLELDMFFVILALAGSETTRNAISQGLIALLDHRDQLEHLRADRSLMPAAVDELIRWASPVLYFGRAATRDVELGGALIRTGDRVVMWYPSGNRDEATFADPFHFDVRRSPNPHVSFGGGGPHYCLGANLAKREVQIVFTQLLDRFREIEITAPPRWAGGGIAVNVGVSVESLPVRFG